MKKTGKKILTVALAVILAAGLAGGAYLVSRSVGGETVNVYPVSQLAETDYWGDSTESYGSVTTDRTQSVYLSSTQTVSDVYVKEGQTVKKGEVLMSYDTTLSEVEVEKKDLEIQKLELDLKTAKSNLEKVKKYRPGVPVSEKNQIDTELGGYDVDIDDDDSEDDDMAQAGGANAQAALAATGWQKIGEILSAAAAGDASDSLEQVVSVKTESGETTKEETTEETTAEEETTEKETTEETTTEEETTEKETTEEETTEEETTEEETTEEETTEETTTEEETTEAETTEEETTEEETTEEETTEEETTEKETTEPETTTSQEESTTAETTSAAEIPEGYPEFTGGSGKEKSPYVYQWKETVDFDQELMEYLAKGKKKAFVKLLTTTKSGETETEETYWIVYLKKTKGTYILEMREICVAGQVYDLTKETEEETEEETTEESTDEEPIDIDPVDPIDEGIVYTAAEIAELRSEVEENIRDLDLEIRTAEVEYKRLKLELDNGSVICEVDGTVTTVRDEEEAKINNQAFIDISGGGGYYVEGSVSELDLGDVVLGQTVTVTSQETGLSCEGEITEISEYPSTDSYWSGVGNSNASYYPFKVFIDESADLQDGEYVSLSYQAADSDGDSLYLINSMIRTENGSSYVYVQGEDGKLERRDVKTGKTIWTTYVEIQSGLSEDDLIAFPYGKSVKEGAATREADIDELYNY